MTCSSRADASTPGRRPGDVQLAYGEAADGRILHISEVSSGLACGCVCPECKGELVAHKGDERAHHFVHHAPTSCAGAYESALHKLAKQLIADRGLVTTPAIVARHGDEEQALRAETVFRPDSVVLEKGLDGMRPDVIARKGDRALLVEVAVTHFCGPEKIALIHKRQLAAIEIDLRKVPHDAPKEILEGAILFSAPRYWLFNRHEAGAVARMQAEAERRDAEARAREERQRQQRLAQMNREADRLAAAYRQPFDHTPPNPTTARSVLRIQDAGLAHLLLLDLPGSVCFSVPAATWQSVILDRFYLAEHATHDPMFRGADVWKVMSEQGLIRPEFLVYVDDELVKTTRDRLPDFRAPYEAITAFLEALEGRGLLFHARNRWRRAGHKVRDCWERIQKAARGRTRVASLKASLSALLAELPDGHGVDPNHWMRTAHPGLDGTPVDQAMASEWSFNDLVDHLRRLRLMRQPSGPVVEDLLGLPLEQDREARREERRVADEAKRRQREEQARQQAEEARQAALERRQTIIDHVIAMLGYADAQRWLAAPLPVLDGISVNDLDGLTAAQQEAAYKALRIEQHRLIEADQRRVHPLRSDLKVLKAVKDRSGAYQVAVSMERPEYHPYRIVRFMIARTEPLRRHLREQIVQIDERLRTGRGGLELRKQRERLAEMARSPWLYASRGKGVGSVSALSGQWVTTVTQIMRAVIEKHDVKGDDGRRLSLSAKDARHVWIGFAYEESGYQWLVAKLAAGHKGIETLRRYLNKRRWKSHGEQRIARLQNAIWAELGERRPVDGAVLRWLVEHGHITEVERQRLADWRRSRSRIGMRCRDPRSPPPDISPDHPAGSVCRVQRCTMCHHGFVFDDSLDGLAMRCAELVFIQKNMPFESWSRSTFPEEMEGVGEALALFPADEVERRVAAWTNKFESGEATVFQFEGAYGEAAHAED